MSLRKRAVVGLSLAVAATGFYAHPASANPAGDGLVISEAYLNGGSAGATYTNKYVELYNPTNADIPLTGLSLQYRSPTGTGNASTAVALSGTIQAHGYFVLQGASNGASGTAVPGVDLSSNLSPGGGGGTLFLANGSTAVNPTDGGPGQSSVVDLLGYGSSNTSEGTVAGAASVTTSLQRQTTGGVVNKDSDVNSADFTALAPSPDAAYAPPPPPEEVTATIAEIQGTGAASELVGKVATTRGVVTAAYPTGGLNGFYIQTPSATTENASDAIFVFGSAATSAVTVGDYVEVVGLVKEFAGTTELETSSASDVTVLSETAAPIVPLAIPLPATEAEREAHEGELLAPTGGFTVTNTFATNSFAEIGLAAGDKPLIQPTDVADAQDKAAIEAITADNAARAITLDDGASLNFLSAANQATALPWLTKANPIRVGAPVTFHAPVVLEFRNNIWKFQPTSRVTGDGAETATFKNTRTPAPEDVGGNLRLATFNVLNYFNTTGKDFVAAGGTCTFFNDRLGDPVTDNTCTPDGPRGAAEAEDLERQQAKIVAAINALGANIVSLEEIENSVKLIGETNRDDALSDLVAALNEATGSDVWAYAPSPAAEDLPALAEQDVIRSAFIYKPAAVDLVGASKVLVGSEAFASAREPLAQAFKPAGAPASSTFAVIVNHFKSKGSGTPDPDGQGNSNVDRVAQAHDLSAFATSFAAERGTDKVFLTGDFNSYSEEDPLQVLYGDGYTNLDSDTPGETTYSFSGLSGSLDHVLANGPALELVTGVDIWNINSGESVAFEYSRHNYNVTDFYEANPYRASDHDPEVVGLDVATQAAPVELNILGLNDFHGRINANTVKWAGTVEQLSEGKEDHTLLVGAGDLIGASEFASAVQQDQPTIDVLNALGLDASAVGNHEFDQGIADLQERIIGAEGSRNAQWDYLGANVYAKGTTDPVLPEYASFTLGGLDVAVVGAVTEETRSLVSPAGIADLTFGDPVDAVNRVAGELSDGDAANGEADVIIAAFHAGATQGLGSSYAAEVAKGGEFADMASLDASVDVIFNGHTHQVYAFDAPVPGSTGTSRPIVQTGEYASNVGQVTLTVDPTTGEVSTYQAKNVARTTVADADLVAKYPRVAKVKTIVDAALAKAAEIGNQPVGSITADITRAFNGTTEDRGAESTLGDLVANSLRDGLPSDIGSADLGIVNPGGLRADLKYAAGDLAANPANTEGVVTFAEANAVLPFVNNVSLVSLTGAQLKSVLEEQWQPVGSSRPFLALGLSDNVQVTQDAAEPAGSRITSVIVDGEPLDPAKTYTVSTFSFLAAGGDNFASFKQGAARDTGLVDRDLWIGYLKDNADIAPDFARQQVAESGLPSSVVAGDEVSFTLSKLNLTSLGSPENITVSVYLRQEGGSRKVGNFPVTGGTAEVSFTAPVDLIGSSTVVAIASPTDTQVGLPLTALPSSVSATADRIVYGKTGTVEVSVDPADATGTVEVREGEQLLGSATLTDGAASVTIARRTLKPGTHTLTVTYSGDEQLGGSSTEVSVTVAKARPTMTVTRTPQVIHRGQTKPVLKVALGKVGFPVTGLVKVGSRGVVRAKELTDGVATFTLPAYGSTGEKAVRVRYLGSDLTEALTQRVVIRVVR